MAIHTQELLFQTALAAVVVVFAFLGLAIVAQNSQEQKYNPVTQAMRDVESGQYSFLSWYNGWGRHDVWGIGVVEASGFSTRALCADREVQLTPVLHTNVNRVPAGPEQTRDYIQAYNLTILRVLESRDISCEFNLSSVTR